MTIIQLHTKLKLQYLILGLTDLTSPKFKHCNFVMQDYSHILHAYFVVVFCCSQPYRKSDFVLIIRHKVNSILLFSLMKSV